MDYVVDTNLSPGQPPSQIDKESRFARVRTHQHLCWEPVVKQNEALRAASVLTVKNHSRHDVLPVCCGPGGVVSGIIVAPDGQVANTAREPEEVVVVADTLLGVAVVVGVVVGLLSGWTVNTSPSVEMIVGAVRPVGRAIVSEPTIIIPPDDMTCWPAESVDVTAPAGVVVAILLLLGVGWKVNKSPSVEITVGAVSPVGIATVSVPTIMTPPDETMV